MWKNYLKTAARNLWRHKLYTFINLFGLAIGVAFVVLIYLFIQHEFSYDRFHANGDNIYRVVEKEYRQSGVEEQTDWLGYPRQVEGIQKYPWLPLRLGEALKAEIPEIRQFTRYDESEYIVQKDNFTKLEEVHIVDSTFFEVFSFELERGDPATVLSDPKSVVITPEIARRYFGQKDPVGEELLFHLGDSSVVFTVNGLAKPPPAHSSVTYNILMRIENRPFYQRQYENWNSFNTPLFVELIDGARQAEVEAKMDVFVKRQYAESIEKSRTRRKLKADDPVSAMILTPLEDIHLDASTYWSGRGNSLNMFILGGIALLILLIACLNYIALSLAGASGRILEVGVRKVLGSSPSQIARQFWLEAQLLVVLSLAVAIALVELFLPTFNDFVQRSLSFGWTAKLGLLTPLLLIGGLTGLLSGAYPAFVLSRFRPAFALKGSNTYRFQPPLVKGAVVVQFALSVFLIISSLIMYRQMSYINGKDLGYNGDQVLVLNPNTGWSDEGERLMQRLKTELTDQPDILGVSGTNASFNRGYDRNGYETPDGENHVTYVYRVDPEYLSLLDIELIAGRNFSEDHPTDATEAVIVNEALLADLNIEDPIGAEVPWRKENNRKIIGVMKDYHFLDLTSEIEPALLHINPEEGKIMDLMVKLNGQNIPQTLATLQSTWRSIAPDKPFDYHFLDEDVAAQYEAYQRWTAIIGVATAFAIFIACLGLFGLAGIMTVNKTKEIGIRKVLGAGLGQILILLNKDLAKLTIIALVLATPLAWYVMNRWLENFAFKTSLAWWIFALGAALCLALALFTVGYHALRTALKNPVEALRYE